ncbi:HET-domain-containing protein [Rhizodiscina lignyota]|uniref:HET-domain-containing protein n=1 Tax=Rhizodiscina lignyota TaxID=1504668 RepID=A0A9P4IA37_9PEZI|nr:HET-domain-containing protein [Rhizodiscina lignyota]
MLCQVCLSVLKKTELRGTHHVDPKDLRLAALASCRICVDLYDEFYEQDGDPDSLSSLHKFLSYEFHHVNDAAPPDVKWVPDGRIQGLQAPAARYLRIFGSHHSKTSGDRNFLHLTIALIPADHCPMSQDESIPKPEDRSTFGDQERWDDVKLVERSPNTFLSTGHSGVLDLALQWLTTCQEQHKTCLGPISPKPKSWPKRLFQPRRLVDVSGPQPRLVSRSSEPSDRPYATLSHCWGTDTKFLTLTTGNEGQLKQGITFESIPQTFIDAMHVTKYLGLRYLWIDSLCILQSGQGSSTDWNDHVCEMPEIYRNCVINISADRGKTPLDGCFVSRTPNHIGHIQISWHGFCSKKANYIVCPLRSCGVHALTHLPLAKRGWVFQERLLAPRVLHFGAKQIYWECAEVNLASESIPSGLPVDVINYHSLRPFSLLLEDPGNVEKECLQAHRSKSGSWQSITEQYTKCALTFPSKDKFSALAGVARFLAEAWGDEYLAGFFRKHLLWDIVWCIDEDSETSRDSGQVRAPSWSWASIDGPIRYYRTHHPGTQLVAEVLEVDVKSSIDAYNGNQQGTIVLSGLTMAATFRKHYGLNVDIPKPSGMKNVSRRGGCELRNRQSFTIPSDDVFPDDRASVSDKEINVILMPIIDFPQLYSVFYHSPFQLALILQWKSNASAYVRIGVARPNKLNAEALIEMGFTKQTMKII